MNTRARRGRRRKDHPLRSKGVRPLQPTRARLSHAQAHENIPLSYATSPPLTTTVGAHALPVLLPMYLRYRLSTLQRHCRTQ